MDAERIRSGRWLALSGADNKAARDDLLRDGALDPFAHSGFGALVFAAASDAPDAILLADDDYAATSGDVARGTALVAMHLRAAGVVAGERVLIVAGAQVASVVALAAALRLGAEPALVPCGTGPVELAACARNAATVAIIGPSHYGELDLGDAYLSAASLADNVRVVATQGPQPVDGAIDLSVQALAELRGEPTFEDAAVEPAVILTFGSSPAGATPVVHRQAALFADALSLCEQARINPSKRIISTLPPATLAGLVAGPFTALVGASSLALHGPFESSRFLSLWDSQPGSHLVSPRAMGDVLASGPIASELASLILVSRYADPRSFSLPPPLVCDRPLVDLYAFGENTLLARRRTDGEALPPARVTDKSNGGGLGAKLNRARAEIGLRETDPSR